MKNNRFLIPLSLVFTLFILWAISSNLLPTMIRQLMKTCELNAFEASFTESAYWLAYFICPIPIAMFLKRFSYKAGIIFGLSLAAFGAFLFFPATEINEYGVYLSIFFIIATGMCFLETAANPYVTSLGDPDTAPRRLNLAQAFNGLGAFIAAMFLSKAVLQSGNFSKVYIILGSILIVAALIFALYKLPKTADEEEQEVSLERIFAEGNYNNFTVQLGRVPVLSENDFNMIMDSEASGAQIIFGDKYKFKIFAGNVSHVPYQFVEFYNDREEKFNFGVGYHRLKRDGYRDIVTDTNGFYDSNVANIFSAGLGYRFDDNFAIKGSFAQNPSGKNYASTQRRAYSAEIDYKEADTEDPGSYRLFAAYRKFGHMAVIEPTYDISIIGTQGFHVGGEYVFAKNLSGLLEYFIGERVSPRYQGYHTNKIYGKVEFGF